MRGSKVTHSHTFLRALSSLAIVAVFAPLTFSQQAQSPPAPRPFAPGVVTTIPPDLEPEEAVSTHDLVEVRANADAKWKPELVTDSRTLYGMAEGVKFRRDVWCLEFSFKPLRQITVNVRQPSGAVEPKPIWYMVYAVRNTGRVLTPKKERDDVYATEIGKGEPLRFVPSFVLESNDRSASGERLKKSYLDRVIPAASEAIRQREARDRVLLNTVEMAARELPVTGDRAEDRVWGVATWEDVDPRIDFFSVYVGGLTNAYEWTDPEGAYKPGNAPGTGRQFARKTLQLNFWRPGDEFFGSEKEVRYGVAPGKASLYDVGEGVAYRWVYR